MINVAVFASGAGSNALNLHNWFKGHASVSFNKIYCNNPNAGIIDKSGFLGIKCNLFTRESWLNGEILDYLKRDKTDFIVLAGFLWLVPPDIIRAFPNRIINIHPALLPNYGGKGMYGAKVHEAVINDKQKESGITIHLVNEEYDKGKILFQKKVGVSPDDDPGSLASKIHQLEYEYFPETVEKYIMGFNN